MRDHPYHGVPMLAGMWGGCQDQWNSNKNILSARAAALCSTPKANDQVILWVGHSSFVVI